MSDPIKAMISQGDWFGVAKALTLPPKHPTTFTYFTYGPLSLLERIEKNEQLRLEEEAAEEEGRLIEASGYPDPVYEVPR